MLHNEARRLLVEAYKKTHDSREIAKLFSVSRSSVYRLAEQEKKTGSVDLRVSSRGRKRILSEDDCKNIAKLIENHRDITIEEIRENLHLKASRSTVSREILNLGYTYKKKAIHATERDRLRCKGKTCCMERIRRED